MLFNSFEFLVFFLVVLVLYYSIPHRFRWFLLLISSCFFYMAYKPVYLVVLFAIILIDYTAALFIEKNNKPKIKKLVLALSLISNIGILAYFKYYNFIFENISALLSGMGVQKEFSTLELLLPIGLSFHTFQSMAYTIEVARGKQVAEKHLGYFAGYVLFFPQMVAGPIEKYNTLGIALKNKVVYQYENLSKGFRLMLYGLFVKVVIADNFAGLSDEIFQDTAAYSSFDTWIGVFCFSIQIYADFFGYSTIAVGAARCLGINLMDNFNYPYFAHNILEFWKRWHISLTNWFREYVYFSLGGNKVGMVRWILNILLVFTLSGLWHGASWNFIWWGLAHGILYLIESPLAKIEVRHKIVLGIMILVNFILVSLVWVLFRADTMETAILVWTKLFSIEAGTAVLEWPTALPSLLLLFLGMEILLRKSRIDTFLETQSFGIRWGTYTVLIFSILVYSGINTKPFIYFQF
jgi:alginate O-acetyltransferase complex protein AlgI